MKKPSFALFKMAVCLVFLWISAPPALFAGHAPVYDIDAMDQPSMDQQDEAREEASNTREEGSNDQSQDQSQPDLPPPVRGQEDNPGLSQATEIAKDRPPPVLTLEQRMRRVEQQVNNIQNGDANAQVDALQHQVQALQAQVEQLTHQFEQQKSLYAQLAHRLTVAASVRGHVAQEAGATSLASSGKVGHKQLAGGGIKPAANVPVLSALPKNVPSEQPDVAQEQQIYQTAYQLIKSKKYNEAVDVLQSMLKKYPSGQFASNAHYWLGELFGLMGKNDQALREFDVVIKTYPDSPRASDAQLKMGLIFAVEAKWTDAKSMFKKVIDRYPGTASARLAAEQIKQLKHTGH